MTSANHFEDLHQGRGWLNRAAEMLDSCEDHVSDAEFARAAAAIGNGFIQLAAAEREAAAQVFVDERHAAERAEDLERIAANRTEDLERIAAADAKAWEHQDSEAEVRDAVVEAHRAMTARMQAEQAEIEQRMRKLGELDVATLAASGLREKRAEAEARPPHVTIAGQMSCPICNPQAEARPHDDEPRGEAAYLLEGDDEVFTAADGLDTAGRYDVRRRNDPAGKHASCWYFVLDPRHDDHARAALAAYADSCESKRPMLAADLRVREIQAREADRG